MDPTSTCWLHHELTPEQALAIGRLQADTWPKKGKSAEYRAHRLLNETMLLRTLRERRPELAARSFVVTEGDAVVAHAAMEPREIRTTDGPMWIMGLAGVCSDIERRGQGLGAQIVRAAFSMIDERLAPFSVFQTSEDVKAFYERLGSKVVENRFIDSTADEPSISPFWDRVVLRYPATEGWPEGEIDLQGPGY